MVGNTAKGENVTLPGLEVERLRSQFIGMVGWFTCRLIWRLHAE